MSFYKGLSGDDRLCFLRDIFYLGRYNPGYYWVFWSVFGLFLFLFNIVIFGFFVFLMIVWYFMYFILVLVFVYKWKRKHLNRR